MKKETITLDIIRQDLMKIAYSQLSNHADWRFSYIVPITTLAISVGILLESVWIALVICLPAIYHIACYIREYREHRAKIASATALIECGEISIAIKTLDHIATETIYEPHVAGRRRLTTKEIQMYYFKGGSSWRNWLANYYTWSTDFCMNAKGLENISIAGDDFYYVVLQGKPEVACIYPCKYFTLEESLQK